MSTARFTSLFRRARSVSARRALAPMFVAALVTNVALGGSAQAQGAPDAGRNSRWEFMASSGALVPTGAHRQSIKNAQLSTAQLSYMIGSRIAVTTMAGWARSRDVGSPGSPKLDVFTYDVGAEVRAPRWASTTKLAFTPIAGIGLGARSYNYRSRDVDATHNLATYGAVGGELGAGRARVRLEVRDYVTRFKPLAGSGASATRNDVVAMLGLRLVRRGS